MFGRRIPEILISVCTVLGVVGAAVVWVRDRGDPRFTVSDRRTLGQGEFGSPEGGIPFTHTWPRQAYYLAVRAR